VHWYVVSCSVGSADEILVSAQVIAATCVGAGDSRLAGRTFKLCALDEASQVDVMPQMPLCHGLVNLRCDNTDVLVARVRLFTSRDNKRQALSAAALSAAAFLDVCECICACPLYITEDFYWCQAGKHVCKQQASCMPSTCHDTQLH